MIEVIVYPKWTDKEFDWYAKNGSTPNSRLVHGRTEQLMPFRPNPPNPLGRHPFNIITEEIYK